MPRSLSVSRRPVRRRFSRRAEGWRVLVVSGDLLVRLGVRDMLEELGNTVQDAPDAEAARAFLAGHPTTQAIVCDAAEQGHALDELRREHPDVKVIYATDTRHAAVPWADIAMPKPYSLESLAFALMQLGGGSPSQAAEPPAHASSMLSH